MWYSSIDASKSWWGTFPTARARNLVSHYIVNYILQNMSKNYRFRHHGETEMVGQHSGLVIPQDSRPRHSGERPVGAANKPTPRPCPPPPPLPHLCKQGVV